ncbi:hypothetical protein O3M35_011483 [Rhynocoris fuscipes]|uniref:Fibronectin type-III domain-containing protein n=1 Tax=Rhynocoris fuscipes TaxID=488301 RepID=A0AAW1CVX1_9HEMI
MSTAATETIIENHVNGSKTAVKAFSDKKKTSGKNGFKKETSSKDYFLDIVKEAISKKLSDDDEAKENPTNFVVSKVVEIEGKIVNSELVNEASNSVQAEVISDKIENNQRICELESSLNEENDLQVPIKSEIEIVSSLEGEMGTTISKLINGESSESLSKEDNNRSNSSFNEEILSNTGQNKVTCSEHSSKHEMNGNENFEKHNSIIKIEEDISTNQTLESKEISDKCEETSLSEKSSENVNFTSVEESVEKSVNSSLNNENSIVSIQQDVKSSSNDNETSSKEELNSKDNKELSEIVNPVQVENEIIVENTLNICENENSMECNDENADKTVKNSLKRASTPDKDDNEASKKIKLSDTEDNSISKSNKRLSTECDSNETKKLCTSNSYDIEQPITSNESIGNSDDKGNKENNENLLTDEKKDKIKDLKKLNKEKLKKKELKKVKDKDTISSEVNDKNECSSSDVTLKTNETEETSENENMQPGIGKIKLKKKIKGPVENNDECELLDNTAPTSCPICSCDCKFKKDDRKILGEKSRGLIDILSGGSDNININLVQKLEELVGQTVVDWATNKCDVGAIRKKTHFLEEEYDRLLQLNANYKKQLDDAKCIIKRMIDEKLAQKSWSEGIVPLKVTRSVGMQVCTTGSAHVLIKRQEEKDKGTSRLSSTRISSSSVNVTTPELQTSTKTSDSLAEGIINEITASSVSNSNSLNVTPVEVNRMDIVGNSKVVSPSRVTPRLADGAQTVVNMNIIDDDIEVIEPVVDSAPLVQPLATSTATTATITTKNSNISNEQILISATLATFNSATNTTTTSTASKTIAPGIYILKTADVPNAQNVSNQLHIAAAPTQQASTPNSEVIDLTDNDPVSFPSNTPNSNRVDLSTLRLPVGQTATANQNAVNFAVATGVQNKVVTFPADSTTFLIHRSPTNANSSLRKPTLQPPSTTDILLTTMSSLPPLPRSPKYGMNVLKPPRPILRICRNSSGIMLSWNFDEEILTKIRKYQVFAYQEGAQIDVSKTDMWKKVGDVDALPLPMACTLTQFKEGHKYYFVVRAMDANSRLGEFSLPGSIMLTSSSNTVNKTTPTRV